MLFNRNKTEVEVVEADYEAVKEMKGANIAGFFKSILKGDIDLTSQIDSGSESDVSINNVLSSIHKNIKSILSQIVGVSGAAYSLGGGVDLLKSSIRAQNKLIGSISGATEVLSKDIKDISNKTELLTSHTQKAINSADQGRSRMEDFSLYLERAGSEIVDTGKLMEALKHSTDSIHTLTEIINDITSRLDILSINASIEAARAGSSGAGFGVIAKEIRNLSSSSANAIEDVNSVVDTIIGNLDKVDSSMGLVGQRIGDCLDKSSSIREDFNNINNLNLELNREAENIAELLKSQDSSSDEINRFTGDLMSNSKPILEMVDSTDSMSRELHSTVDTILKSAAFRLDWHNRALKDLKNLGESLSSKHQDGILTLLKDSFEIIPYVELFYLMDLSGTQISENIVNPQFKEKISIEGKGEDRSSNTYVSMLIEEKVDSYVSGIYVSSASRDLCITASIYIEDSNKNRMILAADMNIRDFISL